MNLAGGISVFGNDTGDHLTLVLSGCCIAQSAGLVSGFVERSKGNGIAQFLVLADAVLALAPAIPVNR